MWRQTNRLAFRTASALASRQVVAQPMRQRLAMPMIRFYSAAASHLSRNEVEKRIMDVFRSFDKVQDSAKITPTANFANDLGLDSLDTVEVVVAIEEEFGIEIPDAQSDEIKSIDNAVEYILAQPEAH